MADYNAEAEQTLLSDILKNPQRLYDVEPMLPAEAFYRETNRIIYRALVTLHKEQTPIDMVTLVEALRTNGALERVGGLTHITYIASLSHSAANAVQHAEVVLNYWRRRQLADLGRMMQDETCDLSAMVESCQKRIAEIATGSAAQLCTMQETMLRFSDWMSERAISPQTGILTGIAPLDIATHGLEKKSLIIVAGRPGMGKTAFVCNLARGACMKHQKVLFFSLEMPGEDLLARLVSLHSGVPAERVFHPNGATPEDWEKIMSTYNDMAAWGLSIDDRAGLRPADLFSRARQVQGQTGLDLILVDYLQLIRGGQENRVQEISYISGELKRLAKELGVPVVAISQLSRSLEQRQDKRPMLSDLRDSGSIEQDADMVITLYRDKYYTKDEGQADEVEVDIKKYRNGRPQRIVMEFDAEHMRYGVRPFSGERVDNRQIPF